MELLRDTPFEVAWVVTPMRPPRPTLTVVVKATLRFDHGAPCAVLDAQRPVSGDRFDDDDPTRELIEESDLAPVKPRGECFVLGSCHAPQGRSLAQGAVAFRVGAVQKALAVFGDRSWQGWLVKSPSAPTPFTVIPLRWSRALGDARNPLGRNANGPLLPNIEDPAALITSPGDRPAPAGCAPIPRTHPARVAKAGTYDATWQKDAWPFLPADHDPAYHLASPIDQQTDGYWRGDEEIVVRGMHPARDEIRARLPGLAARIYALPKGARDPVALRARLDTITVDVDAGEVRLLWRATTEVASEKLDDLDALVVWHGPMSAGDGDVEARRRVDAWRAREAGEDAGFAPVPVPDDDDDEDAEIPTTVIAEKSAEELAREADVRAAEAEFRAQLDALGVPKEMPAAPELPKLSPEEIRAALARANIPVPEGFGDPPEAPDPPAPQADPDARGRFTAALGAGHELSGEDFTDADLSELVLSSKNLAGAYFKNARFTGSRLDKADLSHATLAGATLDEVPLDGADLRGADLTNAKLRGARLRGAKLDDAILEGADLRGADLTGASLDRCEARGANFDDSVLEGASLVRADLTRASLARARAAKCVLTDATLEGAKAPEIVLTKAELTRLRASDGAVFTRASLRGVTAPQSNFDDASLDGADLGYADFTRALFNGANLRGASLDGAGLRNVRASNAKLARASLLRADAMEMDLEGADLEGADLRGANLYGAMLWRARTRDARFDEALLGGTLLARFAKDLKAHGG